MSEANEFVMEALTARLNSNLQAVLLAGYDVALESDEDSKKVRLVRVIPRVTQLALPGPGAETPPAGQTAREPKNKEASATGRRGSAAKPPSGPKATCRFCKKTALRSDNKTGVCSNYKCREEHAAEIDAGKE